VRVNLLPLSARRRNPFLPRHRQKNRSKQTPDRATNLETTTCGRIDDIASMTQWNFHSFKESSFVSAFIYSSRALCISTSYRSTIISFILPMPEDGLERPAPDEYQILVSA
jgi:hypothetical protein